MYKATIILIASFLLVFFKASGQDFTLKHEEDSVKIYYRWKEARFFNPDKEKTLLLFLANENDQKVKVSFTVNIYRNIRLEYSSDTMRYCVPANYELTGRYRNLEFSMKNVPLKELEEGKLEWEIENFIVEENPDCEPGTDWWKGL